MERHNVDGSNRLRVLLVDDNHDNLQAMAELLRAFGCEVEVAYNGELALPLVRSYRPDCVIFDMDMPVMDGHALAQTIRTYFSDQVLLIGMSGHTNSDPRVVAVLPLVDHWFGKPVDYARLETELAGVMLKKSTRAAGD